jgi:SAM-dependent methyltransferase
MSEIFDFATRLFERLPRYLYVEDLIRRRRVLELDFGDGAGCDFAMDLDAREVVGVDPDPEVVTAAGEEHGRTNLEFRLSPFDRLDLPDASFDLVVIPRGTARLGDARRVLAEIRRVLRPDGFLYLASPNPDRRSIPDVLRGAEPGAGERGYYDLYELLSGVFAHVKMIGQSPFVGTSLVEFAPENPDELAMSMDDSLMEESEDATTFLALCGERPPPSLDFNLVQLPYFDLLKVVEEEMGGRGGRAGAGAGAGVAPAAATDESWAVDAPEPVEADEAGDGAEAEAEPEPERAPVELATLSPVLARAIAAARTPEELRRLRGRERTLRLAYGRLVQDAGRMRARTRHAAREAAREREKARAGEALAAEAAREAGRAREALSMSRLERMGLEAEHRKELQDRDDRIGELLQKVVRLTQKSRDLEAKALDAKFAAGNSERAQAAASAATMQAQAGEKRARDAEERIATLVRENEGLRAALAEARSAPQRETGRDAALRERDRRIAELAAEVQAMEWRVEEAVGEAARLERALRAAQGTGDRGHRSPD